MYHTLDQNINGFKNKGLPIINGARPTALRINKNSSLIHKKPSKKPSPPVIIYAYSPKVIHTRPQDFMALVQSLTGLDSSQPRSTNDMDHGGRSRCYEEKEEEVLKGLPISGSDHRLQGCSYFDHGYSSTSLSDGQKNVSDDNVDDVEIKEECMEGKNNYNNNNNNNKGGWYLVSPNMFRMSPNEARIGDIPLYTPTGIDWAF